MSTTRRPVPRRRTAYGPGVVVTFDEDKRTAPRSVDAANIKKIDKILGLVEQMLKRELAQQPRAKSLMEEIEDLAAMYERDARQQGINPFPEALGRDYDAENPHMRKDGKFGYETPEDRVTVPARLMQDSARRYRTVCEEAESAYAARNPHKSGRNTAGTARDSARRPMTICEQCEAAYAARNPHKRKEMR